MGVAITPGARPPGMTRPDFCTEDCPGVCGCDRLTYCNRCIAASMGIDTLSDGVCGSE